MKYTIEPVCLGYFLDFEQSKFTYGIHQGVKIDVPLLFWIVKGPEGVLLVDTGSDVSPEAGQRHGLKIRAVYNDYRQALAEHDVDPLEVKEIILTHLHWDHCYHLEHFPNAVIYSQKQEVQYAIAPIDIHYVVYERNKPDYLPAWLPYVNRMKLLDGDCVLHEGIEIYTLPGHTKGQQGVLVDTLLGKILICGDAFAMYENYENHIPPAQHISLEVCEETDKKAHRLTDIILPGHDMKVLEQKVYG